MFLMSLIVNSDFFLHNAYVEKPSDEFNCYLERQGHRPWIIVVKSFKSIYKLHRSLIICKN